MDGRERGGGFAREKWEGYAGRVVKEQDLHLLRGAADGVAADRTGGGGEQELELYLLLIGVDDGGVDLNFTPTSP